MFEHIAIPGDYELSSGRKSSIFYDFHRLQPKEMELYSTKLAEYIKDSEISFDYVVAPATGGVLPGYIVSYCFDKFLYIVEKDNEIKPYKPNLGEYIIVDDVITSFGTVNRIRENLPGKCVAVASFIYRGSNEDQKGNIVLSGADRGKLPRFFHIEKKEVEQ